MYVDISKINSAEELLVLQKIVKACKDAFLGDLEKVILFGSRARNDSTEESDFDILVLGDFKIPMSHRRWEIDKRTGPLDFAIDYVPFTLEEYSDFIFRKSVDKEGVVLYEKANRELDKESGR